MDNLLGHIQIAIAMAPVAAAAAIGILAIVMDSTRKPR